jgi:hypothetical protein
MTEKFSKLMADIKPQVQKAHKPKEDKYQKAIPRKVTFKMQNIKTKKKNQEKLEGDERVSTPSLEGNK